MKGSAVAALSLLCAQLGQGELLDYAAVNRHEPLLLRVRCGLPGSTGRPPPELSPELAPVLATKGHSGVLYGLGPQWLVKLPRGPSELKELTDELDVARQLHRSRVLAPECYLCTATGPAGGQLPAVLKTRLSGCPARRPV